ncbi:MAG: Rrf2 family transcriptional regulator [Chloroflexi bacterium]|nr:Rrf2 family transcriptional regulator [Chloroflexota bacterium]
MRVPMKVDYGVRALVELAQREGGPPTNTAEIASRQDIPEPYLDQVLSVLQKFGFIRSRRGPQGGHTLAISASEIKLGMVVETLDGTSAPLVCIDHPSECTLSSACAQREVWQTVEATVQNVLDTTTIADLAVRQQNLTSRRTYYI